MVKNIIFDWSGTLSDDLTPVVLANNGVFRRLNLKIFSRKEFRQEFVLPYMEFYKKHAPGLSQETAERMFREEYDETDGPTVMTGAKDALKQLYSMGISMTVLSAHPQTNLEQECRDYGIFEFFKELKGSTHDKMLAIAALLRRNGFDPADTAFVGDMVHDIDTGRAANLKTVAITTGYHDEERLRTASPDHIIHDLKDLIPLISSKIL